MQTLSDLSGQMTAKLAQLGIPSESIKVFGRARCNIHIICVSRSTAQRWAHVLHTISGGARVTVTGHAWEAKTQHGTCLRPTMRHGYLIAVAF